MDLLTTAHKAQAKAAFLRARLKSKTLLPWRFSWHLLDTFCIGSPPSQAEEWEGQSIHTLWTRITLWEQSVTPSGMSFIPSFSHLNCESLRAQGTLLCATFPSPQQVAQEECV